MNFDLERSECKVCKTFNLVKFISFGEMPAANAFLKEEDLPKNSGKPEYKYEMEVGFCENCKMVQLINIVPYDKYIIPDETGKTHYAFFSSTSKAMQEHFAEFAKEVEDRFLNSDSKVMEIGSNDGIMLKSFKKNSVLGIEPSGNVAEVAQQQGIETITKFFSEGLAMGITNERGRFGAILSTNVFLNIIDIHDFMRGVKNLLDERGVFITEDPYIVDILEKNSYDQIYDEHIWYFSLNSLSNLCEIHGLEIFDAERQWVHGGSIRIYMCRKGAHEQTERFKKLIEEEREKNIHQLKPYLEFSERVKQAKQDLSNLLRKLKFEGKKIVGYAAASKGTIVQNYCDIGTDILDYVSDSTPLKQGLYTPGKHIKIVPPESFREDKSVDYALLSAWNHADEIMKKERDFLERGGRFIVHYPSARILEPELTPKEIISKNLNQKSETFEGIELKKLNVFANDQGYLFETIRSDDEIFGGTFGQVLVSELYPGVIKGLHKHKKQTDYTACIKGNIKYVVAKENSDGTAEVKTFVLGENNQVLIKVPPGYWHGYMPLENKSATILHLMDTLFDPKDDDTERKPHDAFGDVWTVKPS